MGFEPAIECEWNEMKWNQPLLLAWPLTFVIYHLLLDQHIYQVRSHLSEDPSWWGLWPSGQLVREEADQSYSCTVVWLSRTLHKVAPYKVHFELNFILNFQIGIPAGSWLMQMHCSIASFCLHPSLTSEGTLLLLWGLTDTSIGMHIPKLLTPLQIRNVFF